MALNPPFSVVIEKTLNASMMNHIRSWMDHRKIQPALFTAHGVGFQILFNNEDEATLFEQEFPRLIRQAV